jgi:hypothetical protein
VPFPGVSLYLAASSASAGVRAIGMRTCTISSPASDRLLLEQSGPESEVVVGTAPYDHVVSNEQRFVRWVDSGYDDAAPGGTAASSILHTLLTWRPLRDALESSFYITWLCAPEPLPRDFLCRRSAGKSITGASP